MKRHWFLWGSGVLFASDQILKTYAEQNLEKNEERKLTERVVLRRVNNNGMCLNLLSDQPETVRILSAGAAGIVTALQCASLMKKKGFWKKTALSLLAAGAWSNTFDRFIRGYVVDYIGFKCENEKVSRITYNLGDFFIGAGALLLSVTGLFERKREEKSGSAEEETDI